MKCSEKADLAYFWGAETPSLDPLPGIWYQTFYCKETEMAPKIQHMEEQQSPFQHAAPTRAPVGSYPLPEFVWGIQNNICHLQGVPKPTDVGQPAILMAFSFLPAEFAPLCMELIKYS